MPRPLGILRLILACTFTLGAAVAAHADETSPFHKGAIEFTPSLSFGSRHDETYLAPKPLIQTLVFSARLGRALGPQLEWTGAAGLDWESTSHLELGAIVVTPFDSGATVSSGSASRTTRNAASLTTGFLINTPGPRNVMPYAGLETGVLLPTQTDGFGFHPEWLFPIVHGGVRIRVAPDAAVAVGMMWRSRHRSEGGQSIELHEWLFTMGLSIFPGERAKH